MSKKLVQGTMDQIAFRPDSSRLSHGHEGFGSEHGKGLANYCNQLEYKWSILGSVSNLFKEELKQSILGTSFDGLIKRNHLHTS